MRFTRLLFASQLLCLPLIAHASEVNLAKFFNHYPFEEVAGETFDGNEAVQRVVRTALSSSKLESTVLKDLSVVVPIDGVDGYMQSRACEAHNCGDHNRVIAVKIDGSKGAVCYYNAAVASNPRWFVDGVIVYEQPTGDCETGRLASPVMEALMG